MTSVIIMMHVHADDMDDPGDANGFILTTLMSDGDDADDHGDGDDDDDDDDDYDDDDDDDDDHDHVMITWWSHDDHMMITWWSHDERGASRAQDPVHRRVWPSRAPTSQNPVHRRGGYRLSLIS